MSKASQAYKRIAEKVDKLGQDCKKCIDVGKPKPSKAYPGFNNCWRHMRRAERGLSKKHEKGKTAQRYGGYLQHTAHSIKLLRGEAEARGELNKLYDPRLDEELMLARLLVQAWLQTHADDADLPLRDLLECLKLISQLSDTAVKIEKIARAEMEEKQLAAIIQAISHAFHKANLSSTPERRAEVFASEVSTIFSGGTNEVNTPALPAAADETDPVTVDGVASPV